MDEQQPVVAAFDFDCTISTRDTLLPFLFHCFGYARVVGSAPFLVPFYIGQLIGLYDRQKAKERLFCYFFDGFDMSDFQRLASEFSAKCIPKMIRPKARERIEWHKKQGHRLVVVSAAVEYYLKDWCAANGFDAVVATRLQTKNNKLTGLLDGTNCRRQEKVTRLQQYLATDRESYTLYAYGDSVGDKELLDFADQPFYRKF